MAHPYEEVLETVRRIRERCAPGTTRVRPWIQDFADYAFDRRQVGAAEIRSQVKAADDAGAAGWMLWNPRTRYTTEALAARPASSER